MKDLGYSMNTGVLPVGRLPHALRRDNRYFGERRLSLLVICLENQGNDSSNEHAELKNPFPCNIHTCHPLSFDWGQRSITPEKIEGNRLPGRCWQHHGQHITRFDRLQGKKRGVYCPAGRRSGRYGEWCQAPIPRGGHPGRKQVGNRKIRKKRIAKRDKA